MRVKLLVVFAIMLGLVSCNKKEETYEVTNVIKSDAVILTESHIAPLRNGDTIRLSIEQMIAESKYGIDTRDGVIDTSWFAKVFIDSTLIAQSDEIPWKGLYVVDFEAGTHELFSVGRINMKEFSLHDITLVVTE